MTLLAASASAFSTLGVGVLLLLALGFRGRSLGRREASIFEALALAWLFGCGGLSFLYLSAELAGVSVHRLFPFARGIGLLAACGAAVWIGALARNRTGVSVERRSWAVRGGLVLLALGTVVTLALAVSTPMHYWDERFLWAFKAKVIFHEGGVFNASFLDPDRYHHFRSYPLLVPFAEAHAALSLGNFDDAAIKFIFPLFFVALGAIFHAAVRRHSTETTALCFTLYLVLLPAQMIRSDAEGGSWLSGYADIPLAAYAFAAFVASERFLTGGDTRWLRASALLLAMAVFTKREGALFAATLITFWVFLVVRGRLSLGGLSTAGLCFALPLLAFLVFLAGVPADAHLPDSSYLELLRGADFSTLFDRPEIARRFFGSLLSPRWGFAGLLTLATFGLGVGAAGKGAVRAVAPLLLYALVPAAAYLLAYHMTPYREQWHLDVSLNRLQSHFIPLPVYSSAILLTAGVGHDPVREEAAGGEHVHAGR